MAQADNWLIPDTKARKRGERTGLDTGRYITGSVSYNGNVVVQHGYMLETLSIRPYFFRSNNRLGADNQQGRL